ncbi:MAG: lysophospholipid acyltransferase family protein [Geminicoccales bacterium]
MKSLRLGRRILNAAPVQGLLAVLIGLYLRLIEVTNRWSVELPPEVEALIAARRSFVGCFWHSRLALFTPLRPPGFKISILVSGHRDGLLIARAMTQLEVGGIEGSSSRGGAQALRGMTGLLCEPANIVCITPDGPRGPRMRAKPGALKAAQLSEVPLVPAAASISRRLQLGSWDRFCLPLPFGRGVIKAGAPLIVPPAAEEEELERLRQELEARLNALTAELDTRLGHAPVAPAPAGSRKEAGRARA